MPDVHLSNAEARRVFLDRHLLWDPPAGAGRGADLIEVIRALGFVQVDSVRTVARAHDMILFARRPAYRPKALKRLIESDRLLFEHWTHDASVIPMEFYPHWRRKMARETVRNEEGWQSSRREGWREQFEEVLHRIETGGPVRSGDVGEGEPRGSGGWWDWHPSKAALEFLWRRGDLAICHRHGFQKAFDLSQRVIPEPWYEARIADADTVDWAMKAALDRLGFATSGELAAFFKVVTPEEAKAWVAAAVARGVVEEVTVEMADGRPRKSVAWPGLAGVVDALGPGTDRVRVLSPFDPALRDRNRAERLFDFRYRIEIYVPAPKREYGYYVFPVWQGDRAIGRIDMTADRTTGMLEVRAFWPERGMRMGSGRQAKLDAELVRVARFAGVEEVRYAEDWLRK